MFRGKKKVLLAITSIILLVGITISIEVAAYADDSEFTTLEVEGPGSYKDDEVEDETAEGKSKKTVEGASKKRPEGLSMANPYDYHIIKSPMSFQVVEGLSGTIYEEMVTEEMLKMNEDIFSKDGEKIEEESIEKETTKEKETALEDKAEGKSKNNDEDADEIKGIPFNELGLLDHGLSIYDKSGKGLTGKLELLYLDKIDFTKPGEYIFIFGIKEGKEYTTVFERNVYVVEDKEEIRSSLFGINTNVIFPSNHNTNQEYFVQMALAKKTGNTAGDVSSFQPGFAIKRRQSRKDESLSSYVTRFGVKVFSNSDGGGSNASSNPDGVTLSHGWEGDAGGATDVMSGTTYHNFLARNQKLRSNSTSINETTQRNLVVISNFTIVDQSGEEFETYYEVKRVYEDNLSDVMVGGEYVSKLPDFRVTMTYKVYKGMRSVFISTDVENLNTGQDFQNMKLKHNFLASYFPTEMQTQESLDGKGAVFAEKTLGFNYMSNLKNYGAMGFISSEETPYSYARAGFVEDGTAASGESYHFPGRYNYAITSTSGGSAGPNTDFHRYNAYFTSVIFSPFNLDSKLLPAVIAARKPIDSIFYERGYNVGDTETILSGPLTEKTLSDNNKTTILTDMPGYMDYPLPFSSQLSAFVKNRGQKVGFSNQWDRPGTFSSTDSWVVDETLAMGDQGRTVVLATDYKNAPPGSLVPFNYALLNLYTEGDIQTDPNKKMLQTDTGLYSADVSFDGDGKPVYKEIDWDHFVTGSDYQNDKSTFTVDHGKSEIVQGNLIIKNDTSLADELIHLRMDSKYKDAPANEIIDIELLDSNSGVDFAQKANGQDNSLLQVKMMDRVSDAIIVRKMFDDDGAGNISNYMLDIEVYFEDALEQVLAGNHNVDVKFIYKNHADETLNGTFSPITHNATIANKEIIKDIDVTSLPAGEYYVVIEPTDKSVFKFAFAALTFKKDENKFSKLRSINFNPTTPIYVGEKIDVAVIYSPVDTTQAGVKWTITQGNTTISINPNNLDTIKLEGLVKGTAKLKVESTHPDVDQAEVTPVEKEIQVIQQVTSVDILDGTTSIKNTEIWRRGDQTINATTSVKPDTANYKKPAWSKTDVIGANVIDLTVNPLDAFKAEIKTKTTEGKVEIKVEANEDPYFTNPIPAGRIPLISEKVTLFVDTNAPTPEKPVLTIITTSPWSRSPYAMLDGFGVRTAIETNKKIKVTLDAKEDIGNIKSGMGDAYYYVGASAPTNNPANVDLIDNTVWTKMTRTTLSGDKMSAIYEIELGKTTTSGLENGTFKVYVIVADVVGNIASEVSAKEIHLDTSIPTVTFQNPYFLIERTGTDWDARDLMVIKDKDHTGVEVILPNTFIKVTDGGQSGNLNDLGTPIDVSVTQKGKTKFNGVDNVSNETAALERDVFVIGELKLNESSVINLNELENDTFKLINDLRNKSSSSIIDTTLGLTPSNLTSTIKYFINNNPYNDTTNKVDFTDVTNNQEIKIKVDYTVAKWATDQTVLNKFGDKALQQKEKNFNIKVYKNGEVPDGPTPKTPIFPITADGTDWVINYYQSHGVPHPLDGEVSALKDANFNTQSIIDALEDPNAFQFYNGATLKELKVEVFDGTNFVTLSDSVLNTLKNKTVVQGSSTTFLLHAYVRDTNSNLYRHPFTLRINSDVEKTITPTNTFKPFDAFIDNTNVPDEYFTGSKSYYIDFNGNVKNVDLNNPVGVTRLVRERKDVNYKTKTAISITAVDRYPFEVLLNRSLRIHENPTIDTSLVNLDYRVGEATQANLLVGSTAQVPLMHHSNIVAGAPVNDPLAGQISVNLNGNNLSNRGRYNISYELGGGSLSYTLPAVYDNTRAFVFTNIKSDKFANIHGLPEITIPDAPNTIKVAKFITASEFTSQYWTYLGFNAWSDLTNQTNGASIRQEINNQNNTSLNINYDASQGGNAQASKFEIIGNKIYFEINATDSPINANPSVTNLQPKTTTKKFVIEIVDKIGNDPVISGVVDKIVLEDTFDLMPSTITAIDTEDGNITDKIIVKVNSTVVTAANVHNYVMIPGNYLVEYTVRDLHGNTAYASARYQVYGKLQPHQSQTVDVRKGHLNVENLFTTSGIKYKDTSNTDVYIYIKDRPDLFTLKVPTSININAIGVYNSVIYTAKHPVAGLINNVDTNANTVKVHGPVIFKNWEAIEHNKYRVGKQVNTGGVIAVYDGANGSQVTIPNVTVAPNNPTYSLPGKEIITFSVNDDLPVYSGKVHNKAITVGVNTYPVITVVKEKITVEVGTSLVEVMKEIGAKGHVYYFDSPTQKTDLPPQLRGTLDLNTFGTYRVQVFVKDIFGEVAFKDIIIEVYSEPIFIWDFQFMTAGNNLAFYIGEMTVPDVSNTFVAKAYYELPGNIQVPIDVFFEWDSSVVNSGGLAQVKAYVKDPYTGKRTYSKDAIYVYALNRPIIGGRDFYVFEFGEQTSPVGYEYRAFSYAELPNFKTHEIERVNIPLSYNKNGLDTSDPTRDYYPFFTGSVVDFRGVTINVRKDVRAIVMPIDNSPAELERKAAAAGDYFWVHASETLHLAKTKERWTVDITDYLEGGTKHKNLTNTKNYDIRLEVTPSQHTNMSSEILEILKEQTNSSLYVDTNDVVWTFHSKDFRKNSLRPTGYYPLTMDRVMDANINKLISGGTEVHLDFGMDKDLAGIANVNINLGKDMEESAKLGNPVYLFNYNKDTNKLELVGKMKNETGGRFSINLSEVRDLYVVSDHLPGSLPKAKNNDSKQKLDVSSQVNSYRISEKTLPMDKETYDDIENNLLDSGKTISQITLTDPKIIGQDDNIMKNIILSPITWISMAGVLMAIIITIIIRERKKRRAEKNEADIFKIEE